MTGQPQRPVRTLTLGYLSLADVGPRELVLAAGAAGFRSVGLRLTARRPSESWDYPAVTDRTMVSGLAGSLASQGLALSNVSAFHLYPEVTLEDLKPVIEAAVELGARTLIGCVYRTPDSAAIDFLSAYADCAGAAGLRIALEVVSYSACGTLSVARQILQQVNSPVLGLMLDPLHLQRGGSTWASLRDLAPADVCIAQLCDATIAAPAGVDAATEARTMRRFPGDGELPIAEFLDGLPGTAELEIEVPAVEHRHLPPAERAAMMRTRCREYLALQGIASE